MEHKHDGRPVIIWRNSNRGGDFMKFFNRIIIIYFAVMLSVVHIAHAGTSPQTMIYKANQALEKDPKDAKAYYNRGTAQLNLDNYEAAVSDFTRSISLEPKSADTYFNRGLAYRLEKKNSEAIQDFSKAIGLHSNNWAYYFERCNARIVSNDFDGAIADGSEVIRLTPKEAEGYFIRGLAHYLKGDLDAGLTDAQKALEIKSWHPGALRLKAEILEKRNKA